MMAEPNSVSYDPNTDPAALQLAHFQKNQIYNRPERLTTLFGQPVGDATNMLTAGPRGPSLLQDTFFLDEFTHFDRERIPERVVHAKGAAAFGYFEVTRPDIQRYCRARLFNEVGKRTPVAARFSTVIREMGSADTVRDPRGFAIKFYTEEGIWDLVGNNTPVFFVRDALMFINFIHSQKRNSQTRLIDYNARWDFFTLRHEALYQVTYMFGDRGIPDGHRHMDGYGSNTYALVNGDGQLVYNKFLWRTNQGVKNLDVDVANRLTATDPDYGIHDLFNAISRHNYPSWTLSVQVMTREQADNFEFNPFDVTKVWPEDKYPPIEVGRMVLDRNPTNYFAEVEQLAFNPDNRVDGIEFSPDKMLQGRTFSYSDTHRYRLGANYNQIPVNRPTNNALYPTERDGRMVVDRNQANIPNYYPNSFLNASADSRYSEVRTRLAATDADRFESRDEDNYTQVRELYLSYGEDERRRLYDNIASELSLTYDFIQERAYDMFARVHHLYGEGVKRAVERAVREINGGE